jgi:hypothetical protein
MSIIEPFSGEINSVRCLSQLKTGEGSRPVSPIPHSNDYCLSSVSSHFLITDWS